ncbi:MAG: rod shape-determining protein MreD [Planctomycetota bacterium]|nr:MAG: rod shape-determining protein MreD [Planctomycetota bacterium]
MHWFRFAVFVLIVTVLQAGLADIVAVTNLNIKPDLLLILLVFFAVYCNTFEAIITSFVIGFAADIILFGFPMGSRMISFGLFGTALAYLNRVVTIKKMPYQSVAIFITALLAGTLAHLLDSFRGQTTASNVFAVIFGTSLYSSLVGPFLFLPSAWWMRIKVGRLS